MEKSDSNCKVEEKVTKNAEVMDGDENSKRKEPGLEERFAAIESILDQMEAEDVTLDQSFALYKQGLEQIKAANRSLDSIEKAMQVLNENGELEEF